MAYKLLGAPTSEDHGENLIHLFVRDNNGAPMPSARIKVWAGNPPTGQPAYWTDDVPFRTPNAAGMLEFVAVTGPMPEDRHYWMQVVDASGSPQSEPVQFFFARGKMIWLTATLQQEGAPGERPTADDRRQPSAPPSVNLDARLASMNVRVETLSPAPGQAYWKIISVQFQDEHESGGNHHVYYTVLDENGMPVPGVPMVMDWQGREANDVPAPRYTDGNGTVNEAMYKGPVGWRPAETPGPYTAWVGDPDLRGNRKTGIAGEKLVGVGLPMNRHVNFVVTWKKVIAGAPAQPAQPPAQPAQPARPAQPAPTGETTYTVQTGDTMFGIARKFGVSVDAIAKANNIANPSLIKPGQVLKIPRVTSPSESEPPLEESRGDEESGVRDEPAMSQQYTVQGGDTLFGIARKFGVTIDTIVAANNIQNRNLIRTGQTLTIPAAGASPSPQPQPKPEVPTVPSPQPQPQPDLPAVPDWYPRLPPATRPSGALPLKDFPRPPNDNGRGIHFGLDVSPRSLEEDIPKCLELGVKWILFYCGDEMQSEKCAVAAWNAGMMPVIRPKCKINGGQPNWAAFVQKIKQHNIPAYIQIYNEPGDNREWRGDNTPRDYEAQFARNFAGAASQVLDAGGYPGIQILGKEELSAAVNAVRDGGNVGIWNKAWFSLHNYGVNHPPAYPYDEINQREHPRATILEDDVTVIDVIAFAIWMQELIGFVLPTIGGEGGWIYGSEEDRRYRKCNQPDHANYHVEMFDWFRKGYLSNGQPLPDYLFSVAPWILSGYGEAEAWYGGVLGTKTETVNAVKAMPPFVRKFSWDM